MNDVTVIHGDSILVLPGLPPGSVDCMVTDPPYGTETKSGYGRKSLGPMSIMGDSDLEAMDTVFRLALKILKPSCWVASFCSPKRRRESEDIIVNHGFKVTGEVVWDKGIPGLGKGIRYQHETILLAKRGKSTGNSSLFSVIRSVASKSSARDRHPHFKPVSLVREIIEYVCKPGEVVLDPFGGGGSTAVACMKSGRKCVIIESDSRWIPIIQRRIKEAETPLFAGMDEE